jgi:nucleoside transporter
MSTTMPMGTRVKLSAMMFLQFMMLPVWFLPMFPYVGGMEGAGNWPFWCGLIMAFGTFSSPLFGMFADRFMNSERVLALCNFVGAALLAYAYTVKSPETLFFVLLLVMLFYMPTWSLTATIAMSNSTTEAFPQIRVFGTLGWVASSIFSVVGTQVLGIDKFDTTPYIFLGGAIASALGGALAFLLPRTPPKAKGQPMSVADALGLRSLVLLKRPEFAFFTLFILLAMVPFMWYMVYNTAYLKEKGFQYLTLTTNLGQTFELIFMLLIPVILKKAGYKWAMVIGLAALTFRYGAFYLGATGILPAGDFGGILIHGLIFGLLIVGAQMYVDAKAPSELRGQAQGLMGLVMFGLGTIVSNNVFDRLVKASAKADGSHDWSKPYLVALVLSAALMVTMALLFPKPDDKKA